MSSDMDNFRQEFYVEAREILENVSGDILKLEADASRAELLHSAFRGIHTIKGSASMFELGDIAAFTHHLESLMTELRDGRVVLTSEMADVILSGVDHIGGMVTACESGIPPEGSPELVARFNLLCMPPASSGSGKTGPADTENEQISGTQQLQQPLKLPQENVSTGLSSTDETDGFITDDSVQEFVTGTLEMLHTAEQSAILLEGSGSVNAAINEIFRAVHNIKGDADFVGFSDLATFCHALESMLEPVRQGSAGHSSKIVDIVLKSLDYIGRFVHEIAVGKPAPPLPDIFHTLKFYGDKGKKGLDNASATQIPQEISAEMRNVYLEQLRQYHYILASLLKKEPVGQADTGTVIRSVEGLKRAAEVVGHSALAIISGQAALELAQGNETPVRSLESTLGNTISMFDCKDQEPKRIGEILVEDGIIAEKELDEALSRQKPVGQILIDAGRLSEEDLDIALRKQELMEAAKFMRPEDQADSSARTMRVDERKIEHFSNTVGEMLIARNTYAYLIGQLENPATDFRETFKALKDNLHLFSRLSNDIHHGVIGLRMVPVKGIFQKFGRVVRDISRKQKKIIQLLTDGEDIEIDKKVADALSDPLVHIIRNSCDHGIESPLERKKAGKPEKGTLLLRASKEGSNIMIRIIDDGKGLDRQKLYDKAMSAGMNVSSPDDSAIIDLIFLPGLSTASEITDVSGRGVGMDVVKTTVESLGGTIRVISDPGKGTEITLAIPTSMGIDTVLFVEASGRPYAIPIADIVETIKISPSGFRRAGKQILFHFRNEVLSVHHLGSILGCSNGNHWYESMIDDKKDDVSIVIVKTSRGKRGIIIDRPDRNMEIAVKPVPDAFSHIDVISGVSIMGDGKVLLVLNPDRMFP